MNDREFNAAVRCHYDKAIEGGQVISRPWLTQQIVASWSPPMGEDADKYLCCAYRAVRAQVEKEIRASHLSDADDAKTLPGFHWVQQRYAIVRGKDLCDVPTSEMTVSELRAKARELRRMSIGLMKHADELERYADIREAAKAG